MNRLTTVSLAAMALSTLTCSTELPAQVGADRIQRPINTPTFSPYLNMFRGRNDGGLVLNYYGLVRPQQQALEQNELIGQNLQSLQSMQMQQGRMPQQAGIPGYGYSQLGITGHPVAFQTFNNVSSGGFSAGGMGGAGFGAGGGFRPSPGGMIGQSNGFGGMGSVPGPFGGGGIGGPGAMMSGFATGRMSGHPAAFGSFNGVGSGQ